MDQYREIITNIQDLGTDDSLMALYRESFEAIIRAVEPETIYEAIQDSPDDLFRIAPLYAGSLFVLHRFQGIYDFLCNFDLCGSDRSADYFNGKLLKYYYTSLKYLGRGIDSLYRLMATNREYGNEYSVSVLTNCILDFQINNDVYMGVDDEVSIGDAEERAKYCFYSGIVCLVNGEYGRALAAFNEADILNKSRGLELKIKKYTIVSKLLLSDFSIFYPYMDELRPYFSLIGSIRRADLCTFNEVLETHRAEFFSLNLFYVVRRLLSNLLQEGLRKISICYSRISVADINEILGVNVDYLLHSTIKSKFIRGYVEDGIFHSQNSRGSRLSIGDRIAEVVGVRSGILGMMTYPEITPLTYETYLERESNAN